MRYMKSELIDIGLRFWLSALLNYKAIPNVMRRLYHILVSSMSLISFKDFDNWLRRYGDAWEKGDSGSTKALFTSDVHYYETPFDDPMIGLDMIYKYWRDNAELGQENVTFVRQL